MCYMDDIFIAINIDQHSKQVIDLISPDLLNIGLEINPNKCVSTENGGTITVLG